MKNLQLSLKKEWFEMTKSGIKTEDYREITPYWCSRLMLFDGDKLNTNNWAEKINLCGNSQNWVRTRNPENWCITLKKFIQNTMTLGYPKSGDAERILKLEHKGIKIRIGNPDWGAEPDKLYFVILHGHSVE